MGTLPLYFALCPGEQACALNTLDIIACAVSVGAAAIQYVADGQMRTFRRGKPEKGSVMEGGLWRYVPPSLPLLFFCFQPNAECISRLYQVFINPSPCSRFSILLLVRFSRHPNYFGELSFWLGLSLHGLAGGPTWSQLYLPWGFVSIFLMFVFASVPMMEKRSLKSRPKFAHTMQTTSMLMPWFRFQAKVKKH